MKEIIEILSGEFYGLFCGIFGCVIEQYPYDNTFWKKEIQLYLTGDARPAFCNL